jgi:endonuclease YncB( thermonuclease family)
MTRARSGATRRGERMGRVKDVVLTLSFLFLLALIAARLEGGVGDPISGPFRAVDGDTLAAGGVRLRLADIDAPELDQTCEREGQEWDCGRDARSALQRAIAGGAVECRGHERDRYGRLLVRCFVDGRTLGGMMVRAGMAVRTGLITYRQEQIAAEEAREGIWAGTFTLPSDWRRERRLEQGDGGFLPAAMDLLSLDWL